MELTESEKSELRHQIAKLQRKIVELEPAQQTAMEDTGDAQRQDFLHRLQNKEQMYLDNIRKLEDQLDELKMKLANEVWSIHHKYCRFKP